MVGYGYKLAAHGLSDLIESAIKAQQKDSHEKIRKLESGQDVALAVIDLIAKTHKNLPSRTILDVWTKIYVPRKRNLPALLWQELDNGKSTASCMARGTLLLAAIWDAAWKRGQGDANIPAKKLDPGEIQKLYSDSANVPSIPLGKYREELGPPCCDNKN
jgi:hypothetical protein